MTPRFDAVNAIRRSVILVGHYIRQGRYIIKC